MDETKENESNDRYLLTCSAFNKNGPRDSQWTQ